MERPNFEEWTHEQLVQYVIEGGFPNLSWMDDKYLVALAKVIWTTEREGE